MSAEKNRKMKIPIKSPPEKRTKVTRLQDPPLFKTATTPSTQNEIELSQTPYHELNRTESNALPQHLRYRQGNEKDVCEIITLENTTTSTDTFNLHKIKTKHITTASARMPLPLENCLYQIRAKGITTFFRRVFFFNKASS